MRKVFLITFLVVAFSIGAAAQIKTPTASEIVPANFISDGCSMFPDGKYRDCCVVHDLAYFNGGNWKLRWRADKELFKCVAAKRGIEHKFIAPVMWLGVRSFGVDWLPTSFRWGFGRAKKDAK